MRLTLTILLLYPLLLAAQCFASFETFAAAGISGTPANFTAAGTSLRPVRAVRFGFGAGFALSDRVFLRTAVQLSQYGDRFSSDGDGLRWGTQHDGLGGFDPDAPSGEIDVASSELTSRHYYVEGLLAVRYLLRPRGRVRPFVEGGLALSGYSATKLTTSEDEWEYTRLNGFRSGTTVARVGGGTDVRLNKSFSFYAMPVFQYHLSSLNEAGQSLTRAWQGTVEIGLRVFVDPR